MYIHVIYGKQSPAKTYWYINISIFLDIGIISMSLSLERDIYTSWLKEVDCILGFTADLLHDL